MIGQSFITMLYNNQCLTVCETLNDYLLESPELLLTRGLEEEKECEPQL
jgi:hypothetical protein